MKMLIPPVLFLLCLAMMVLLRWLWPLVILWSYPYTLLGILPLLLGLLSGFLGIRQFRLARTNIHPFHEADKLVTEGPYRYSRNPMYLGLAMVLFGAWVLLGALSALLGVVIFIVVADRWYIRVEERMLAWRFTAAFDAYRARTRRWI